MFGFLAAVFAAVGLIMSLSDTAVKPWVLWATLLCIALSTVFGFWPFGTRFAVGRRAGS